MNLTIIYTSEDKYLTQLLIFPAVVAFIFTGLLVSQFIQRAHSFLKEIGKENIIIYATPECLAFLNGSSLIVDTRDSELDEQLFGFYNVSMGHGKHAPLQNDSIYQEPRPTDDLDDESRRILLCLST